MAISQPLLNWYHSQGRKNLPWQHPKDPYRIWISEVMLQQTQVQTVIPFFERFMAHFPNIQALSSASEDAVLALWSGLGYYSRARNIHKTAKIIAELYQGIFPSTSAELIQLPGIGASTAAAILSLAFDKPTAILDANVKRVLSRYFMVEGAPNLSAVQKNLWQLADSCMPKKDCAFYTQAIMDLGALCCVAKNPTCTLCPLKDSCQAYLNGVVEKYPFKTLTKKRPTKAQQFLLLYAKDRSIYLEKRHSSGLWGGLWCLPAIAIHEDATRFVEEHYGLACKDIQPFMEFKHSFTHFHLLISAVKIEIDSHAFGEAPKHTGLWFQDHECKSLGLAKPVQQIIHKFYCP